MSGQLELNIAFTCGLIGMGVGWKWGLKQIAGFYDTASAVKHIMFGLVIGTIYALITDELVFRDYLFFIRLEQELVIMPFLIAMLLSISGSLFVMLILTRKSIFATKSGPTSGWCLGLGIGAMFSARFSYLVLDSEMYGLSMLGFTHIFILVFMLPLFEGSICCYQGTLSAKGLRLKSSIIASFGRFFFLMMIPAIIVELIWWVIMIPIIMLMYRKSVIDWIPQTMTQDAKRRYRRIMADNLRRSKTLSKINDFSEE